MKSGTTIGRRFDRTLGFPVSSCLSMSAEKMIDL